MDFSGWVKQTSKASRVYTTKLYVWAGKRPAKVRPRHASRLQPRAAQARRKSLWAAQQQLLHDRCDFVLISLGNKKKKNAYFHLQELQIACSKDLRIKVWWTVSYQILSAGVHVAFWYVIEANFCTCVSALLLHTSCPTTPGSSHCVFTSTGANIRISMGFPPLLTTQELTHVQVSLPRSLSDNNKLRI